MELQADSGEGGLGPRQSVVVITGNYGSGKTEVALNWALYLRQQGLPVTLADVDVVNPYFRCREARTLAEQAGIRLLAPEGEMHHAELPIILPELRGAIEQPQGVTILDVGGDDVGARVLGSFAHFLRDYEMLQVVNQCRPFTDTIEGCVKIQREIEAASTLQVTGLVSNAHLMDETDGTVIAEGAAFAQAVAQQQGQELRFVAVEQSVAPQVDADQLGYPILKLQRLLTPPWRPREKLGKDNFKLS
jgi:MinD-like ATPase involved in chromosome partitioning or flagellar assembly